MLEIKNTVLLVIDIQGKLASLMHDKEVMIQNVQRMIRGCQILNIPIIWTEQVPEKLGPTLPEIKGLLIDHHPISKITFSCADEPIFIKNLHKLYRNQVIVTGIETHICIYQTVRDLITCGHEVEVIVDAVSSRTRENKNMGIQRMNDMGAGLMSTEMVLFELQRIAQGDQFKQIQNMIK